MASIAGNINPLLQEERDKCTFPVEELVYFNDGGQSETLERRALERAICEDPAFKFPPTEFLSRWDQYDLAVKKHCMRIQKLQEMGITDPAMAYHVTRLIGNHESNPFAVHFIMFTPALVSQGTDEQQAEWLTKALNHEIIGTYAQTELGHGTYIRGIETTAHFDEKTQEFVLNTPTLSSTKWWPGQMGKTANHVMLVAQLYTQNECRGLHYFVVPIRDLDTHKLLPGVTAGDIGPKFGFHCNDNGFLRLDNVRIPCANMLAKNAEVLPDGRYVTKREKSQQLSYGTMSLVRSMLVFAVGTALAEAVTIAVRYSAIRLQGHAVTASEDVDTSQLPETKLLDYPTQQLKLVTQLAGAYALLAAGLELKHLYFKVQEEIELQATEQLPKLHAISAGLKAVSTWDVANGVEVCRMACGGHGYSLASGMPQIYCDAVAACTYEGDNTVLLLTTCRFLLKNFKLNDELSKSCNRPLENISEDLNCLGSLLKAHEKCAYKLVEKLDHLFTTKVGVDNNTRDSLYRDYAPTLVHAALVTCRSFICSMFYNNVMRSKDCIKPVLLQLVHFYTLHWLLEEVGDFIMTGCFPSDVAATSACVDALHVQRNKLLKLLRPNLVGLVDGFDMHDRILNSVLGRYDGNAYESFFEWAQQSTLNSTEVHPSFHSYIRPMMKGESLLPKAKL